MATAAFDAYAANYDSTLNQGLAVSGEGKDYFAAGRIRWLAKRLAERDAAPLAILDFGCGTGSAAPYLLDMLGAESITGVDVSSDSIEVARRDHADPRLRFTLVSEYPPAEEIDLVFTNGVFHHITPLERPGTLKFIHESLRPGGWFAFWENNPFNPGTRYVMSRIPFDRDAVLVWPHQFRKLLRQSGFDVISTDYQFIFPRILAPLRRLEPWLARFALGAQYLILARKRG